MLRTICRTNRLLLTGIVVQKAEPEGEKSVWDRLQNVSEWLRKFGIRRDAKEELASPTYQLMKKEAEQMNISGWDRVRMAFQVDENNEYGPEVTFAYYLAGVGGYMGFMYGGFVGYKRAYNLFMHSNDATKFLNVKEARSFLARATMEGFIKQASITAPKFAVLCFIFGVTTGVVSAYRGKNGILEFGIAGAVTTATMKWNLGIRGMISGCVSGGLTGLILGTLVYALGGLAGKSMTDAREICYLARKMKKEYIAEAMAESELTEVEKYIKNKTKNLPIGFSD